MRRIPVAFRAFLVGSCCVFLFSLTASAQLTDVTQTPNTLDAGIKKSLSQQIGTGRGDVMTPGSSVFIINRDSFRSIVRGRQIFQRKFSGAQGQGPRTGDGAGNIEMDASVAAGLADSCATCHARPFGSAGFGSNVFTRPDSRDAPHLFGLGLQEMLADEITKDLRAIRASAIAMANSSGRTVSLPLSSKTISYGTITAMPEGVVDTSAVVGVNADLRVRPFFAEGSTISIREFAVGAFNAEMGLEAFDPDLAAAAGGADVTTPSGMELTGTLDAIEGSIASSAVDDPDGDGVVDEIPVSLVDHVEFYLLNYFKPAQGEQTAQVMVGKSFFRSIGCANCHKFDLLIDNDRRVADVETGYDAAQSNQVFNTLYSNASILFSTMNDGSGHPDLVIPNQNPFLVKNILTDFKRHDLGTAFHERNFDGSITTDFMTEPLWGVASTPPYGHDGRSATLQDVIVRHGGEAASSRDQFLALPGWKQLRIMHFLGSLVLFAPPDTASVLDPINRADPNYPRDGHGSIKLSVLFNDPTDAE